MNKTKENIQVIQNRVRNTADYSGTWYEGDRPNLNWCAFLTLLNSVGILAESPSFRSTITPKRY
jgi:hypothetical protein